MKLTVNYKSGAVCLPASAIDECDDILSLRLLMLLSFDRMLGDADASCLAERLGCDEAAINRTIESLRHAELLEPDKKALPSIANRNKTGEEIAALVAEDESLKLLIDECQNIVGRIFTPTDISRLVSLHTELELDAETILLLFFYFFEKMDAVDRKLTLPYFEKSVYSLWQQGVKNAEQVKDYIRRTEEHNSIQFRLRRLYGMGDRSFTKKETNYFTKWLDTWQLPFELIAYAYEITVDQTGKISMDYQSKILSDWHDSGIQTMEQAEAATQNYRKSSAHKFKEKSAEEQAISFDADEFFDKALRRSYELMRNEEDTD